jgi:hypothetical protein
MKAQIKTQKEANKTEVLAQQITIITIVASVVIAVIINVFTNGIPNI